MTITKEQRERLEMMADGDPKWDLSPNDIAAIRALLAAYDEALRDAERYRWLCDASGQDYERLFSAQMTGSLDAAIDAARATYTPSPPPDKQDPSR